MLVGYGCDDAQGFFFSRPRAAEELTPWLTDSTFGAMQVSGNGHAVRR